MKTSLFIFMTNGHHAGIITDIAGPAGIKQHPTVTCRALAADAKRPAMSVINMRAFYTVVYGCRQ
jgi:hypothetical protein